MLLSERESSDEELLAVCVTKRKVKQSAPLASITAVTKRTRLNCDGRTFEASVVENKENFLDRLQDLPPEKEVTTGRKGHSRFGSNNERRPLASLSLNRPEVADGVANCSSPLTNPEVPPSPSSVEPDDGALAELLELENSSESPWSPEAALNEVEALECEPLCPVCSQQLDELDGSARLEHINACLGMLGDGDCCVDDARSAGVVEEGNPNSHGLEYAPVVAWLESLGLERYAEGFVKEEVDFDSLECLTEEDLISMGVEAIGPRRKLLAALADLKQAPRAALAKPRQQRPERASVLPAVYAPEVWPASSHRSQLLCTTDELLELRRAFARSICFYSGA